MIKDQELLNLIETEFNKNEPVSFKFYEFGRMSYVYTLVLKVGDKHYISKVGSDGETIDQDFEDLDWYEAELVTVPEWKIKSYNNRYMVESVDTRDLKCTCLHADVVYFTTSKKKN